MDFEWDEPKRQANILKHGIDFVAAVRIFDSWFIETEDSRRDYGERRYRAIGRLGGDNPGCVHVASWATPDHQCQEGRSK